MFTTEAGLTDAALSGTEQERLRAKLGAIRNLTPGDFATVKRQSTLLDERLDADAWLEQLAAEAKAKMAGLERNRLGFS